jgi:NADPH-dependent curcumin reductase CurA
MKTKQIVLASRPQGMPTAANFRTEEVALPALKDGDVLLKGVYYSVDPYMRGRMNDAKSYVPPFELNKPITGGVVAEVVESKDDSLKPGDLVMGNGPRPLLPWAVNLVVPANSLRVLDTKLAPASYYLGILGMPGLTAYFGLMDIGKPKAGETVVISGAAGAVGIVVGQIAKIQGCRAVGIAGGPDKVKMLKSKFGFDETIDYKATSDMTAAIAKACPQGVDIYFDNVGGEISDAVMANINFHARVPLCGQISLYNSTEVPTGPRIQGKLVTRSVLMQGFIIGDYTARFPEGIQHLAKWVKEGKLKYTETFIDGFDKLPEALLGLFSGKNSGKMIVKA